MKKPSLAFGVAILALAAAGTYYYVNTPTAQRFSFGPSTVGDAPQISKISENGFGKLSLAQNSAAENLNARNQSSGGSGFAQALSEPSIKTPVGMAENAVTDSSMPTGVGGGPGIGFLPPVYNLRYVYKGEPLKLTADKVNVLRRLIGESASGDLQNYLKTNGLGLVELGSFSNAKLQSFNFLENKDLGYMVTVSFTDGSVSISQDWTRWQSVHPICVEQDCFEKNRVQTSDMLSEQSVIEIADAFLAEHGIARKNFGQPVFDNSWRVMYEQSIDKANFYFPEAVNVTYPFLIDGKEVFDEAGNKTGMVVSIDIRARKVSGLWGLTTQRFESSEYVAETDGARIIQIAEAGGFRGGLYPLYDEQGRSLNVELGTPETALVKIYNWKDGQNEELLVPALIFPVISRPDSSSYYTPNAVVVPLVTDILDGAQPPVQIYYEQAVPAR